MLALMHSQDCDQLSSGKTFRIDTNNLCISINDWGKGCTKHLEIRATDWESYGTGSRGGSIKTVKRTLDVRLFEPNLREIIKYSFAAGIYPEAMSELKEAYAKHKEADAQYSEAMRRLNLTGPNS
jgi:hypothetical protein